MNFCCTRCTPLLILLPLTASISFEEASKLLTRCRSILFSSAPNADRQVEPHAHSVRSYTSDPGDHKRCSRAMHQRVRRRADTPAHARARPCRSPPCHELAPYVLPFPLRLGDAPVRRGIPTLVLMEDAPATPNRRMHPGGAARRATVADQPRERTLNRGHRPQTAFERRA